MINIIANTINRNFLKYISQADLVAYWALDETSGNAIDSIGGNNCTVVGATQGVTGKINTAYSFNGTSNYMKTISTIDFNSKIITVSFWLYWNAFANDDKLVMELSSISNSHDGCFAINPNCSNGRFAIAIQDGGY
jgi:hypothetical protein